MSLLETAKGADKADKVLPIGVTSKYDYVVSVNSLPHIFKTTIDNVPADIPYIFPVKTKNQKPILGSKIKIGICWAGSPTHPNDDIRSCNNSYFEVLSKHQNVQLYSLQKIHPEQKALVVDDSFYIDLSENMENFNDLANFILKMDLIITVDTSVAHLAGALNKEVWNLLCHPNDFRWLLHGNATPWYPSMKLFRQTKKGDWKRVFKQVDKELVSYIAQH